MRRTAPSDARRLQDAHADIRTRFGSNAELALESLSWIWQMPSSRQVLTTWAALTATQKRAVSQRIAAGMLARTVLGGGS